MKAFILQYESLSAISYSDSILQIIEKIGLTNCEKTLWIQLERGEALEMNKNFDLALATYYQIIHAAERQKWQQLVTHTHISIARCHEAINRPIDCLRHLNLAKNLINKYQFDTIYARYCKRYSSYHRIYDNKDTAKLYAQQSIQLGKIYSVERAVFDGHLLMGILSLDLDSAIYHFQKAVNIYVGRKNYHGAASQSLNICSRYIKAERFNDAKNTIQNTEIYLQKIEKNTSSYYHVLSRIHEYRSVIFEKQNMMDSAYFHLQLAWGYGKKAEWFVNQESITSDAVTFAIEREQEKTSDLKKVSKLMRWGLLFMGISIIIFAILLYHNRKKREKIDKQNQVIQLQNEALEKSLHNQSMLLSEVHHRVKNNLQLVISLLTLHSQEKASKPMNEYLDDISAKVRSIALIHEQLYSSGEFENIDVKVYIQNLIENFEILQNNEKAFDYVIDINNKLLNLETVMPIGIICSELVGNSLKYGRIPGKKLKLFIELKSFDNKYIFKFADNGPGIPEKSDKQQKTGMGTVLIKSMVRQLQAESNYYNDQGSHFGMVFTEKKVSKI